MSELARQLIPSCTTCMTFPCDPFCPKYCYISGKVKRVYRPPDDSKFIESFEINDLSGHRDKVEIYETQDGELIAIRRRIINIFDP